MNWLRRIFGPVGLVMGEIAFPASFGDGTPPKAKSGQIAIGFTIKDKAPMDTSYIFAGVVAVVLLLGARS